MTFDLPGFYDTELAEHDAVVQATRVALQEPFVALVGMCLDALKSGNKLLFFGNGGSAADAQHLATELTVRYKTDRPAIPAIALTTDTSALTAIGNDFGFEQLFARQIDALGQPGDVAIGISTSGTSPNIVRGLETAKVKGLKTVGLTGRDGGALPGLTDLVLIVPSHTTARIQEMHIMLGQMLCGALELALGLVQPDGMPGPDSAAGSDA